MAVPGRQGPLSEGDLQALADDAYHYELVEGLLLREPPPAPRHGRLQRRILVALSSFVEERGLGEVYAEVGFVLSRDPDTVRAPDVSFVSTQALARLEDETRLFPGPPDLAVEVLSPSSRPADVHARVADYLAAGTRLVWVVDADRRKVTTYRTLLGPRLLGEGAAVDGEDVLPGFALPVDSLFAR